VSYSFPDSEPAWVTDPDGYSAMWWVDPATGQPVKPIGVDREGDVPGYHTPGAALKIQVLPVDQQQARKWPQTAAEQS
jgi:hypothetical protein